MARTAPVGAAPSKGAAAPPPGRAASRRRPSRSARVAAIALAALCAVGAVYLLDADRDAGRVERANEAGAGGRPSEALRVARQVDGVRARIVEAYALRDLGRLREADAAFARALGRDPSNWVLHRDRALVLARLGRRRAASEAMARAVQLNPRMTLPPGFER